MAESQEDRSRDDLTEEASPYRIEEMRKQGRVVQSKELAGLIGLLGAGLTLYFISATMGREISELMVELFRVDNYAKLDLNKEGALAQVFIKCLSVLSRIVLPICIITFIVSALGSYIQIGSVFSTDPLNPDLNRINPISGIKKFFSLSKLYDGFRLVFKAATVAFVAYTALKPEILSSGFLLLKDPGILTTQFGKVGLSLFGSLMAVLFVFAGFDFWLQRWEFSKSVRLTKQEAKQEHKEHEGDPLVRARIKAVQREMARKRMLQEVKKADVIITNPTHIAIALKYDNKTMDAPRVIAKGADFLAQKIKKLASEAGIPMVENVPLARTLYKSVKLGQFIPRNLFQAVAEVLAYVYKLKGKGFNK